MMGLIFRGLWILFLMLLGVNLIAVMFGAPGPVVP